VPADRHSPAQHALSTTEQQPAAQPSSPANTAQPADRVSEVSEVSEDARSRWPDTGPASCQAIFEQAKDPIRPNASGNDAPAMKLRLRQTRATEVRRAGESPAFATGVAEMPLLAGGEGISVAFGPGTGAAVPESWAVGMGHRRCRQASTGDSSMPTTGPSGRGVVGVGAWSLSRRGSVGGASPNTLAVGPSDPRPGEFGGGREGVSGGYCVGVCGVCV